MLPPRLHLDFLRREKHSKVHDRLFLLILASTTGNHKSTKQQQYGSKLQLLPLSKFPEGQKEFSSQLKVTVLLTESAKLCEMRQKRVKLLIMGGTKAWHYRSVRLLK